MPIDKLFSSLTDPKSGSSPLGGLLRSPSTSGALSGAASGAVVSMLMNKKARKKISKNAVKVGGAAALAGVGYLAYRQWQSSKAVAGSPAAVTGSASPPPPPPPATLEAAAREVPVSESLPNKMVLAMIGAAGADGTIDREEMESLVIAIEEAPLEAAEKSQLTSALNEPPTVEILAALASSPEEASELYGAALTAIEVDTPAEHLFLKRFARALELEPDLVDSLHQTLSA